jgi:molecular chaperone HscB
LSSPLLRGLYLLKLQGLSIEEGSVQHEPSFLAEIMELNEQLANATDAATVLNLAQQNQKTLEALSRYINIPCCDVLYFSIDFIQ